MDTKETVTVWAAILTPAFLQVQGRVDIELNLYQVRLARCSHSGGRIHHWLFDSVCGH